MASKKQKSLAYCRYYVQLVEHYADHNEPELLYYLLLTQASHTRFYFSSASSSITQADIVFELDEAIKLTINIPRCVATTTIDDEPDCIKGLSKTASQAILKIANSWWLLFSSRLEESEYIKTYNTGFVDLAKLSLFSV